MTAIYTRTIYSSACRSEGAYPLSLIPFPIDAVDENGQVVDSPLAQTLRGALPSNELQVILKQCI